MHRAARSPDLRSLCLLALALPACNPDAGLTKFNAEPEAQIAAPSDGSAVLEGTTVSLRGAASDPNHATGELLARWFVGTTEVCPSTAPAADGTTTCDVLVPDGDVMRVRLEVLDPEGAIATAEAAYVITPNAAPTASIASPTAEGVYYSDQLATLRATVADAEDAASDLQVRWTSTRDGELGQATPNSEGLVESFVTLSEGAHAVQLFVTDSAGNEGQASVLVDVGPPNTAPSCTITAPADGGASVDGARVDFRASTGDVDVPADRLNVRWSSDKDGDLGVSTPDTAGNVAFSTSTLSVNTHRVTMTVTDEVGATCTTGLTWSVGTPPEVTLETPLPGEVSNEGEGIAFRALVSDREDVAGDLTVRWESDRDGLLYEGTPDSGGLAQFIGRDLSVGEHVLTVTVTDSTGLTATTLGTFTVNGIPGAPSISLSPGSPTTVDDLVVRIDAPAVDPDGDPLVYTYTWTRDGVVSAASTSAALPASATTDGEVWAVEVSASDGLAIGPLATASVRILNSAPSLTRASITPDPARRGDTLTCTASGYADADGDTDLTTFAWTVDGVAAGTGATLTAPFIVGALVACTATPNDGKDTGAPLTDSVVIEDSLPVVTSVTLSPSAVTTNDTLTANVVSSDPDGDSVTLRYRWFKDGVVIAGATGSSLSGALAGSFGRDDVVTVEVTPNDGALDGASVVSAGVTVLNSAPTAPVIAITPESPEAGDDLTCSVVTPSADADGDPVTYTFAWDQDGAAYAGATDAAMASVVAGADVGGGETWTCEVVAGDGTGVSARAVAEAPTTACGALRFDGTQASPATIPGTSSEHLRHALTVETWMRVPPGTPNADNHPFRKHVCGYANGLHLNMWADNPAWFVGNEPRLTSSVSVSDGRWHHVAGTFDGSSVAALWVDGVRVAVASTTMSATNSADWVIGGGCSSVTSGRFRPFIGDITAMRISNVVRYTSTFTPALNWTSDTSTMALWMFDEASGATFLDTSGNGRNGTLSSGVTRIGECPS